MRENDIAREIVDAAYRIHTTLGPGLLESVYEAVLTYELEKGGLRDGSSRSASSMKAFISKRVSAQT